MPIGTSGPRGKGMKWSTLGVRRLKLKVTEPEDRFEGLAEAILDLLPFLVYARMMCHVGY